MLSEAPAAIDPKTGQFGSWGWKVISQHRELNTALLPKLIGNVKPILVERVPTWRKRSDQGDFHDALERNTRSRDSRLRRYK